MASLSSVDRPLPFSFEHAWAMTEAEFVRLTMPPPWPSPRGWARLAALLVFGVAGVFWRYTFPFAVLALLFVALVVAMPRMMRSAVHQRFVESEHSHGPVSYGVSSRGFWLRGRNLGAECDWPGLTRWDERETWLILSARGMPPVYLPVGDLRAAGVYGDVKALARAHAPKHVAPGASRPAPRRG